MNAKEITAEVHKKEKISELFFMAYASKKQREGEQIEYKRTQDGHPADFYLMSGTSWSLTEAKDRLKCGYSWFLKPGNGPFLEKKKFDGLMAKRNAIYKQKGFHPDMFYFNFCLNALVIYKIDPSGEYEWYEKDLQKNDSEKSANKITKLVCELYNPVEIMIYKLKSK